jgi:hypothetical protein
MVEAETVPLALVRPQVGVQPPIAGVVIRVHAAVGNLPARATGREIVHPDHTAGDGAVHLILLQAGHRLGIDHEPHAHANLGGTRAAGFQNLVLVGGEVGRRAAGVDADHQRMNLRLLRIAPPPILAGERGGGLHRFDRGLQIRVVVMEAGAGRRREVGQWAAGNVHQRQRCRADVAVEAGVALVERQHQRIVVDVRQLQRAHQQLGVGLAAVHLLDRRFVEVQQVGELGIRVPGPPPLVRLYQQFGVVHATSPPQRVSATP